MLYFAGGDSGFYFAEQLRNLSWLPQIWHPEYNLGISTLSRMWFDYPFTLLVKIFSSFGFHWDIIEKILWISVLFMAMFSIVRLSSLVFRSSIQKIIAVIVYSTNTYILMVFGGGQIGVALAYGFAPITLFQFLQNIDSVLDKGGEVRDITKNSLISGLLLSLLIAFDLRLAYLIVVAVFLYLLIRQIETNFGTLRSIISQGVFVFIIPGCIALFTHMFWILPIMLSGWSTNDQGEMYTGMYIVKDLSFADLPHALSLLHANWPENLFGRVYFMQPEFLVLPFIAFATLLMADRLRAKGLLDKGKILETTSPAKVTYFTILALLGAFLAKGVKLPFGEIYYWLYSHVPGFVLFRDSSKFYLYIALGYAVLIPLGLQVIAVRSSDAIKQILMKVVKGRLKYLFSASYENVFICISVIFIIFWGFTIRQLLLGQLFGQFILKPIPPEYVKLKDLIVHDMSPYRTLWLPVPEKFAFSSDSHPVITGSTLFINSSAPELVKLIGGKKFKKTIFDSGVKYIIVPIDVEKRIFLSDYKYDVSQRKALIDSLTKSGLVKLDGFSQIAIFTNPSFVFKQYKPDIVSKQEYWVKIGLFMSMFTIISIAGTIVVLKLRK